MVKHIFAPDFRFYKPPRSGLKYGFLSFVLYKGAEPLSRSQTKRDTKLRHIPMVFYFTHLRTCSETVFRNTFQIEEFSKGPAKLRSKHSLPGGWGTQKSKLFYTQCLFSAEISIMNLLCFVKRNALFRPVFIQNNKSCGNRCILHKNMVNYLYTKTGL
ncbi:MAG: hypothetical protein LBS36_13190 [Oscillospiraceae bacterium]|nr:hypothetical protein [Oscillospiraceae bacterium]